MTRRQLHRTALYDIVYASFGGEYLLGNHIATPESIVLALAFFRQPRGFTAREQALLDLARPYLREAYRSAATRDALAILGLDARLVRHEQGARPPHHLLRALGRPASRPARRLATAHRLRQRVPSSGRAAHRGARGGRLVARLLAGPPDVVQLKEEQVGLSAQAIVSLGLRQRENDVLVLVAQGAKDSEAARALGITTRTVHKHLEQIYQKLGVHTRTAAAALAHEAARAAA
jgi:DNA-binding CsgD family transcriptional regulator